jgi:extracellular elastinolytic metalloproteinase
VPVNGENRYAIGPYVTSDHQAGIRNYGMNRSPLNYSDVGYDLTGPQVHADGEIWSATNFDIRQAMIARYDSQFPLATPGCSEPAPTASARPTAAPATAAGSRSCSTPTC